MPHTPGPWRYDAERGAIVSASKMEDWSLIPGVCDEPIPVSVISTIGAMGGDDAEADAALICAAPALLQACVSAERALRLRDHVSPETLNEVAAILVEVIAKAEGRT